MGVEENQSRERPVRVFISYSHEDEEWKERVVGHLRVLGMEMGFEAWDDRRIEGGQDWQPAIERAIDDCSVALLLISVPFLTSKFIRDVEVPRLLRRRAKTGVRVIPVILSPCAWKGISCLELMNARPRDGKALASMSKANAEAALSLLAEEVAGILRPVTSAALGQVAPLSPEFISLGKLPTVSSDLFGRDEELKQLDTAWATTEGTKKLNVLPIIAPGGVGKSALVIHWLDQVRVDGWRGAQRVFGWSFYSQGTSADRHPSADSFINHLLDWLGEKDYAQKSPWDKGNLLAQAIRRERMLLVLDGLEPLQQEDGRLRDDALKALLKELAWSNPGLCIGTSRLPLTDLQQHHGHAVREMRVEPVELVRLSPKAGAGLLASLGVQGKEADLEAVSIEFGGHSLALTLLGRYLHVFHSGKVRQADEIPKAEDVPEEKGRHARRIMRAYETVFLGKAELDILHMLGLFDRPAPGRAFKSLRVIPGIDGLTDHTCWQTEEDWTLSVETLRDLRLVSPLDPKEPDIFDCHPLVREHFAETLKKRSMDAWREGHKRLYQFFSSTPDKPEPTLEDLQPLYQAVAHGCQAGMHKDAYENVYLDRILRGTRRDGFYSIRMLGVFGADLGAVACFFERLWTAVSHQLSKADQAWLLAEAGIRLQALGRLTEAIEPMRAALDMRVNDENWREAATVASNLSRLEMRLGQVPGAVQDAERSVDYADSSRNGFWRMACRCSLADVLFQAGRQVRAAEHFCQAEAMQAERQPEHPLLYSVQGFLYADLLLARCECAAWQVVLNRVTPDPDPGRQSAIRSPGFEEACREVERRAHKALDLVLAGSRRLLDIAVGHLNLGRAGLYRAILERSDVRGSGSEIEEGVDGLRRAGLSEFIVLGLLSRTLFRFMARDADGCRADLDEAWQIAERGSMRLHMADVLLHRGRLFRDKKALAEARKLIDECGYHRRDEELADAEEAAKGW